MALRGSWATSRVWVVGKGRGGRTPRPTQERAAWRRQGPALRTF